MIFDNLRLTYENPIDLPSRQPLSITVAPMEVSRYLRTTTRSRILWWIDSGTIGIDFLKVLRLLSWLKICVEDRVYIVYVDLMWAVR